MSRTALVMSVLVMAACGSSPYAGYKEVSDDVYLRYIALGEGDQLVNDGDSVHMRFRMARINEESGSHWSTEQWYLASDLRSGAMLPVLRRLHVGDSMSVIASSTLWPWAALGGANNAVNDTSTLRTEVSLLTVRTPAQMQADAARLKLNDPAGYERRLIHAYMTRTATQWTQWGTSDLYYAIDGMAVDTNKVRYHELTQLAWRGKRLEDGRVFDEQGMAGNTFPWSFGTPDQLIDGLGTAVSLLREGQEGVFIIPSALAFGTKGIEGTLEPNTPVVYTLRLVSVQRGA